MTTTRTLVLKRERLTELSSEQLDGLAGGLRAVVVPGCTIDYACITNDLKCPATFRTACPTCGGAVLIDA